MTLEEARTALDAAEAGLDGRPFVTAARFERDGRSLEVAITGRLRDSCRKGRVWRSKPLLTAFKNAAYGFDERRARSPGGADGIFILTREHRPANAMMRKIFDLYLDRLASGVADVAEELGVGVAELVPVRLVSHHLRLLGVLRRGDEGDVLVLVDYDDEK